MRMMIRLIPTLLVGLVCCGVALAGSWETGGFRTANGKLIQRGMTKTEVRRDAGTPLDGKKSATAKSEKSSSGKASSKGKRGDVWTYKGNDGHYAITFHGDKVAKIEVTPFRDH